MRPFTIHVPDDVLADLHARLDTARLPVLAGGAGWAHGTDADVLRDACARWRDGFDWRAHERWLNSMENHLGEVDGATIHVARARADAPGALPLVLLHGWPATTSEFRPVVDLLRDPASHGGLATDAFDVVLVALPGFGFGGPLHDGGWHADRMAAAIARALRALGIERYGVYGTDAGAYVATALAAHAPDAVAGLHLHLGGVGLARQARADAALVASATDAERRAFDALAHYETVDGAYAFLNGTKPYTIAFALNDSPVGQAAWILEKFHAWTDGREGMPIRTDRLLDNLMLYWLPRTGTSAARLYCESLRAGSSAVSPWDGRVDVPTGHAVYPYELLQTPRAWADARYRIVHWTEQPRGGHFAAFEQPQLFCADLRAFRDALG